MSLIVFGPNPLLSTHAALLPAYVAQVTLPKEITNSKPSDFPKKIDDKRDIQKTILDTVIENPVLNRLGNELVGNVFPTVATEFLLRGWKRSIEMSAVMASYIATTFILPTLLMPVWNKLSAKEHNLPENLHNLFKIEYEDLIQEQGIDAFKHKILELEGKEKLKEFIGNSTEEASKKLNQLKENLIRAKTSAIKKNIFTTGLFSNLVYWFKNWFAKNVLGVTGFTGELSVLDENQIARNSSTYEKNKYFLFGGSILAYLLGSKVFSDTISQAVSSSGNKRNFVSNLVRKNITNFDVKDGIYPRRGNLFGMYMTGAVFSYLFASRSVTELIENVIRLVVWLPLALGGDTYIQSKSAFKSDKNYGTALLETHLETGRKIVKSMDKLYQELKAALKEGDNNQRDLIERSIKARKKIDLQSLWQNALAMGVGLTAFNALFSTWRLRNGIGVSN